MKLGNELSGGDHANDSDRDVHSANADEDDSDEYKEDDADTEVDDTTQPEPFPQGNHCAQGRPKLLANSEPSNISEQQEQQPPLGPALLPATNCPVNVSERREKQPAKQDVEMLESVTYPALMSMERLQLSQPVAAIPSSNPQTGIPQIVANLPSGWAQNPPPVRNMHAP